jgi:hypothetical protein
MACLVREQIPFLMDAFRKRSGKLSHHSNEPNYGETYRKFCCLRGDGFPKRGPTDMTASEDIGGQRARKKMDASAAPLDSEARSDARAQQMGLLSAWIARA